MPVIALVAYTVFLSLAFGLRAVVHHLRTGTTGFVGLSGPTLSIEWWTGILFGAAVVGGVLAPAAQLLGMVSPWTIQSATVVRFAQISGIALTGFGIAGTLWAQFAMGDSWRVGVDHQARTTLVSRGPFRWIRNPIFTWMGFASVGLVLLAPNILAVLSLLVLVLALEIQVRVVEEPYLLRTHGESYRAYAVATGRFVPGIGRLA